MGGVLANSSPVARAAAIPPVPTRWLYERLCPAGGCEWVEYGCAAPGRYFTGRSPLSASIDNWFESAFIAGARQAVRDRVALRHEYKALARLDRLRARGASPEEIAKARRSVAWTTIAAYYVRQGKAALRFYRRMNTEPQRGATIYTP